MPAYFCFEATRHTHVSERRAWRNRNTPEFAVCGVRYGTVPRTTARVSACLSGGGFYAAVITAVV